MKEYLAGPIFFEGEASDISNHNKVQCMDHEISGEIVEIGSDVHNLKIGDMVVVEPNDTSLDRHRLPDTPNLNKPMCRL